MRFSLYTLLMTVLFSGSVMAFVWRFPVWRLEFTRPIEPGLISGDGKKLLQFDVPSSLSGPSSWVALRGGRSRPPAWGLQVRNLKTGVVEQKYDFRDGVYALSRDRAYLAYLDQNRCIAIADLAAGKQLKTVPAPKGYFQLLFAENSACCVVWALNKSEIHVVCATPESENDTLLYCFINPDYFADVAEIDRLDSTRILYSIPSELFKVGRGPYWPPVCAINPAQRRLVMAHFDGRISAHDWNDKNDKVLLQAGTLPPSDTEHSSDLSSNAAFAAICSDELRLFRLDKTEAVCVRQWPVKGSVYFSPDSQRVFVRTPSSQSLTTLREFSIETGEELSRLTLPASCDFPHFPRGNDRLVFTSLENSTVRVYVRNHPGGWAGHLHRAETWLMILFAGLLVQRLVSRLRRPRTKPAAARPAVALK